MSIYEVFHRANFGAFAVSSVKIEADVIAKIQHRKLVFPKAMLLVVRPLTLVKIAHFLTLACR